MIFNLYIKDVESMSIYFQSFVIPPNLFPKFTNIAKRFYVKATEAEKKILKSIIIQWNSILFGAVKNLQGVFTHNILILFLLEKIYELWLLYGLVYIWSGEKVSLREFSLKY